MWSITYSYIRYFCFPIVLNARCSRPEVFYKKMFLKVSKNSEIEKFLKNTFFSKNISGGRFWNASQWSNDASFDDF